MQYTILSTQAESNVQNIFVSNPAIGADAYGLTDLGMEQAKQVSSYCTRGGSRNWQRGGAQTGYHIA